MIRRSVVLGVLSFVVGIGFYLGSLEAAGRAASSRPTGTVYLRNQDIAAWHSVQCIANIEAQASQLLCSRRPRSRARYEVAIYRDSIVVFKEGEPDNPVYATPRR